MINTFLEKNENGSIIVKLVELNSVTPEVTDKYLEQESQEIKNKLLASVKIIADGYELVVNEQ